MNIGQTFIPPPLFYYYLYQPIPFHLQPQEEELPRISNENSSTPSSVEKPEEISHLIVTKEDLIEEGYEQTKKAWT